MLCFVVIVQISLLSILGAPLNKKKKYLDENDEKLNELDLSGLNIEYERYLKEVITALESDEEFKKKLETIDANDIKSGKIADSLALVNHNVRNILDEAKRQELQRIEEMAIRQKNSPQNHKRLKLPSHVNYKNPHLFDEEDLKRLIAQTSKEIEKYDRQRKQKFKEYEMQKEYERRRLLQGMDEIQRKKTLEQYQNYHEQQQHHPKIHEPISEDQLEEVWEKEDNMDPKDFDAKTFFHMHDLNGDGFWNEDEVKALFVGELNKLYNENLTLTDLNERVEEMELMREHAFQIADLDENKLISLEEFLKYTSDSEYKKDDGWEPLESKEIFNEEDLHQMEQKGLPYLPDPLLNGNNKEN